MAPPTRFSLRRPTQADAASLGLMVFGALWDAPSSPLAPADVGDDLSELGQELIHGATLDDELLFVGLDGSCPASAIRVMPREFARGQHIGSLQLLVSPAWRRKGLGLFTLGAALAEPELRARFSRLEVLISAKDDGHRALLHAASARGLSGPWHLERVERGGMRVDGRFVDVEVWVVDL